MRTFPSLMASAAVIALWAPVVADAGEKETVNQVFDHEISNIAHKSVRSFIVDYAPGGIRPHLNAIEGVIDPPFWLVNTKLRRHDVVIAYDNDRRG